MLLPQHTQPLPIIDGDSLKKARTEKNLTEAELAKECILVAKHIVQLENGDSSNFFSAHHKGGALSWSAGKRISRLKLQLIKSVNGT
jgi:predicted transcriptional regulator